MGGERLGLRGLSVRGPRVLQAPGDGLRDLHARAGRRGAELGGCRSNPPAAAAHSFAASSGLVAVLLAILLVSLCCSLLGRCSRFRLSGLATASYCDSLLEPWRDRRWVARLAQRAGSTVRR